MKRKIKENRKQSRGDGWMEILAVSSSSQLAISGFSNNPTRNFMSTAFLRVLSLYLKFHCILKIVKFLVYLVSELPFSTKKMNFCFFIWSFMDQVLLTSMGDCLRLWVLRKTQPTNLRLLLHHLLVKIKSLFYSFGHCGVLAGQKKKKKKLKEKLLMYKTSLDNKK